MWYPAGLATFRSWTLYPAALRKQAYLNVLEILPPKIKKKKKSDKNSDIFHISAQNIDCGTH